MPKFALFHGWDYEARGGWDDLGGIFDSVCEAVSACPWGKPGPSCEWAHVVDLDALAIILEGRHHSGKRSGRFYRDFHWTEPK